MPHVAAWSRDVPDAAHRVVFVHGVMDRAASFRRVERRLPEVSTVRYDRRGYNDSLALGATDDIGRHAADLAALVGDRPSIVIGHSYGALVALLMGQEFPRRVNGLGCYEPPAPWEPWWSEQATSHAAERPTEAPAAAEWFMRRMIGDAAWERLDDATRHTRRSEGQALLGDLDGIASRRPHDPELIHLPTVVAYGTRSAERHRRAAAELAAQLPGARLTRIEGAAHGGHMSHPDGFAGFVREVIELATG